MHGKRWFRIGSNKVDPPRRLVISQNVGFWFKLFLFFYCGLHTLVYLALNAYSGPARHFQVQSYFFLLNHISRWLISVNSKHFICTKCYIIITCQFHWGVLDLCFKWQSLPSFSSLTSWSPWCYRKQNKSNISWT
jgi:hypothetical protein